MVEDAEDQVVPLRIGTSLMYVTATRLSANQAGELDEEVEIAARPPSVEQITAALKDFATQVTESLQGSGASRFVVEFGCDVAVETGRVVAMLGKGSLASTLRVTLEWSRPGT
jgi:hypothetical protein